MELRPNRAQTVLAFLAMLAGTTPLLAAEKPRAKPEVQVVVDPRVELMSVIFRLAGNPEYNRPRVPGYVADVEQQFGAHRDHAVVKLAQKLRAERSVSYDAVMSMAMHLTDAEQLGEKVPFDPHPAGLDSRWPLDGTRQFLTEARSFARETKFKEFFAKHRKLYETAESRMKTLLDREAHLEWFDEYFGQRPEASFTVALGMLNGGNCYGTHCRTADGKDELYCILGVWEVDSAGQPQFTAAMLPTVVHEFCHSYTNAIVDRHADKFQPAAERLFKLVKLQMQRSAYGHWKTMCYETLVRGCVARYVLRYQGEAAAREVARNDRQRGFAWAEEFSQLLAKYESDRKTYATLDEFVPQIVGFLDRYAEQFEKEHAAEAARKPKVVSVSPANGAAIAPGVQEIRVVFDRPMQDKIWSLVGAGLHFPKLVGAPSYDQARKIWTVRVELKPNWSYQFMLNSPSFHGFRSEDGVALEPLTVSFKTSGE